MVIFIGKSPLSWRNPTNAIVDIKNSTTGEVIYTIMSNVYYLLTQFDYESN